LKGWLRSVDPFFEKGYCLRPLSHGHRTYFPRISFVTHFPFSVGGDIGLYEKGGHARFSGEASQTIAAQRFPAY
jgi:hypothetical protein